MKFLIRKRRAEKFITVRSWSILCETFSNQAHKRPYIWTHDYGLAIKMETQKEAERLKKKVKSTDKNPSRYEYQTYAVRR